MRENRTCGSEGGEGNALPDPYHDYKQNDGVGGTQEVVDTRDKPQYGSLNVQHVI